MFEVEQWIVGAILIFLLLADGARIVKLVIFDLVALPLPRSNRAKPPISMEVKEHHGKTGNEAKARERKTQNPRRGPP